MKNINCYGNTNKKALVKECYLKPVLYVGLLPNQEKQGCCGKLTDRYYIFKATNKLTKKEFSFFVGKHCAEKLLELINVKPLKFFNPLKLDSDNLHGNSTSNNHLDKLKKKIHPINKELIQVISIISMAWDYPPPVFVLDIIEYTNSLDEFRVNNKGVLWVNRNLAKDKQNRDLTQIISELREVSPNFKQMDFKNIRNYLNKEYPDEINKY
ncbi:hypothetical protein R5N98_06860 [Tenacibaculum maritimum]|uniref:hypothetical protein n=1 Tax=Tenacibaculum maritimum TaxID=107401 RepID=UPI00388F7BD7